MPYTQKLIDLAEELRSKDGNLSPASMMLQQAAHHIAQMETIEINLRYGIKVLRDEFARTALMGILSSWDRCNTGRYFDADLVSEDAYFIADSMMRAREHKKEK